MTIKPDPLRQLLQCLNRAATTAQVFSITEDVVYLSYSTIMSKVTVRNRTNRILFYFCIELCYC
jgi:phosphotransacetylase